MSETVLAVGDKVRWEEGGEVWYGIVECLAADFPWDKPLYAAMSRGKVRIGLWEQVGDVWMPTPISGWDHPEKMQVVDAIPGEGAFAITEGPASST